MHRAWFTEEEVRVATERRLKYQGTAKVRLDQIQFDPPLPRDLNSSNLERLRQQSYRTKTSKKHSIVPRFSPMTLKTNLPEKYPMLHFHNSKLHGLHGRHRVQVVSELLPPVDRWWMVDLYLDGILPWGFNALLAIPGLWGRRMRISMIHCLVTIDCVEEILNYLESVKEFWSSLVNHHLIAMKRIDQDMVEKLQLMAPCASYIDVQAVYGFILSSQAFASFSETE
ncbi:hypothetical protein DIZ76_010611 [Coccidioides immitis]|nr:hypothetical protein DIZ76_010611 [Coccidioides immitis]